MKDDYTTISHIITYTFLFKRLGECTFLNLGVKGLTHSADVIACRRETRTQYIRIIRLSHKSPHTQKNSVLNLLKCLPFLPRFNCFHRLLLQKRDYGSFSKWCLRPDNNLKIKNLKSHVRARRPRDHVNFTYSRAPIFHAISCIVPLTLPSLSPVLVLNSTIAAIGQTLI